MKVFVKLLAIALIFAGLSACAEKRETVTLTYANWNVGTEEENNIQRQLVAAYVEKNPNVTIEFVDMSGAGWDDKLTALAAEGNLPDVFMANNVPNYVKNGWLADLTAKVKNDKDWAKVSSTLKDSFTYNDMVMGLPAAQFIMGYWVNKDLYEAANLDAPEYGLSTTEWLSAVTSLNDIENGVLGLDEQEFIQGWYPNTEDSDLLWFSFDGQHMNYNSAAFKAGISLAYAMKGYTWQGLTDEQKANFTSVGPWELFLNQEVGMRWDASWSVPGFVSNANFNWDFVGIPGGNQALVADVIVVSKTTENLDEAYRFAKWMTFSTEAYKTEVELAKAAGSAPKMPVAIDDASLELYKEFVDNKPGVLAALNNLDNSLIESLAKAVPGYINARWEGKPGLTIADQTDPNMWWMFWATMNNTYNYADYSAQLETFANNLLDDARDALGLE